MSSDKKTNAAYGVQRTREYHSGEYPMTMSDGTIQMVRLHGPYEIQRVEFDLESTKETPDVPHPTINEPGVKFLSGIVVGHTPENHGTFSMHRVHGGYTYVNLSPGHMTSEMKLGLCPSDKGILTAGVIKPTDFKDVIGGGGQTFFIGLTSK